MVVRVRRWPRTSALTASSCELAAGSCQPPASWLRDASRRCRCCACPGRETTIQLACGRPSRPDRLAGEIPALRGARRNTDLRRDRQPSAERDCRPGRRGLLKRFGGATPAPCWAGWALSFRFPYLHEAHVAGGLRCVDTLETATDWSNVRWPAAEDRGQPARRPGRRGRRKSMLTYPSHVSGGEGRTSIPPTVFLPSGRAMSRRWSAWKRLSMRPARRSSTIAAPSATQHGVGKDHAPYLPREKGELGVPRCVPRPVTSTRPGRRLPTTAPARRTERK